MQDKVNQLMLVNNQLTEENQRLKALIKIYKEKDRMNKMTIENIKNTPKENEEEYMREHANFRGETKNKEMFNQYHKTITNEVASSTENELKKENALLKKKVNELIEITCNNDLTYELKIKDTQNIINSKDNQLLELKYSIDKISKETEEEANDLRLKIQRLEEKISFGIINELNTDDKVNNHIAHQWFSQPKHLNTESNVYISKYIKDSQPLLCKLQKSKGDLVLNHHRKILENKERIKRLNSQQFHKAHNQKDNYSLDMRMNELINNTDD